MILYNLKKNKNKKMPNAYGKYYAYPVVTQTIGMDGLATHMSGHNTPFSPGAIKGMLTDMVICVRELALQGIAVKIDNLAIFSIGIKNKLGCRHREGLLHHQEHRGREAPCPCHWRVDERQAQPRCYLEEGYCTLW